MLEYTGGNFSIIVTREATSSLTTDQTPIEREIIRTQESLKNLIGELRAAGRFALDTEFAGERTYVPRLCLIQIATATHIDIIDTLAIKDLSEFWRLLADERIEKVLHAAREDLRIAYYGGGRIVPRNVYDTQVAAGFVGLPLYPLSYARLVDTLFGVKLAKTETRSDWERRPLSPEQVRYARDDVRFLLPIADKLKKLITKLKRETWLSEEMTRFTDPFLYEMDPNDAYLRMRGSKAGFTARPTAILRSVAAWREREAALRNVPSRTILRDEVVVDIALRAPKRLTDFTKIRNFPQGEEAIIGPDILEAITEAKNLPEDQLPPALLLQDDETPQQRILGDMISAIGSASCLTLNIAPELAMTKASANELVKNGIGPLSTGWRNIAIGSKLTGVLNGTQKAVIKVSEDGQPLVDFTPNTAE